MDERKSMSEIQKAVWADPEKRAKRAAAAAAARWTPEKREQAAARTRARWADPEERARLEGGLRSPETKEKMAQAQRERFAREAAEALQERVAGRSQKWRELRGL